MNPTLLGAFHMTEGPEYPSGLRGDSLKAEVAVRRYRTDRHALAGGRAMLEATDGVLAVAPHNRYGTSMAALVRRWLTLSYSAIVVCACREPTAPHAQVQFLLDAPLCSSALPVQFFIDGVMVGTDTFRVHLAADHTASRVFSVSPGLHTLGARTTGTFVYTWPDTRVTAVPGTLATDTLPFYCS